jgi:tetratricopeptide (TPR) repeat protein
MDAAARWTRLALELARKLGLKPREMAALTIEYADVAWETTDPRERETLVRAAVEGLEALTERTDADAAVLARLRDALAHALYELGDIEGARALTRAGLAELGDGPATAARALLLNRLGWTYWRGGPVEDAVPILERAVEEARASSSERTLRWAIHDLGIALMFLNRSDEAVILLEESKRRAEEAGDRDLLSRCYINLPAVRLGRGDDPAPLAEIVDEGLQLARRSARLHTIAWLAANQADIMLDIGRLDEALECQQEAIQRAQAIASPQLSLYWRHMLYVQALRGDTDAALEAFEEAERDAADVEPQVAESVPLSRAWRTWQDDPAEATRRLARWTSENADLLAASSKAALLLARMALRVGDADALGQGVSLCQERLRGEEAETFRAKDAWVGGLARGGDSQAVEQAAAILERHGYLVQAADAWADAALLAARDGRASVAYERAEALVERIGLHPLLGPLPETRWLQVASPEL